MQDRETGLMIRMSLAGWLSGPTAERRTEPGGPAALLEPRSRHPGVDRRPHDRILRDKDPTEGVVRYILENPVRAGLVEDVHEYPLIGAANYDLDDLLMAAMIWRPPWK